MLRQIVSEGAGTLSFAKALGMQMTSKLVLGAAAAILLALLLFLHFSNSRTNAVAGNPGSETVGMTDRETNGRPVLGGESSTASRSSVAQVEASIDPRSAILTATVVDGARQPIAGASLVVENWPGASSVASDARGRIELRLPPLGAAPTPVTCTGSRSSPVPAAHSGADGTPHRSWTDDPPGELRLNAGSTIAGRVISATGEPRAGIDVLVEILARNSAFFAAVPENARYASLLPLRSSAYVPRTKTRADGSFQVQGIEAGTFGSGPCIRSASPHGQPIEARAAKR
jgi:hypothetical protein